MIRYYSTYFVFLFFLLIHPISLFSEVDEIIITWNSTLCNERCKVLVKERLEANPEIESIEQSPGLARIQWKKNIPFSYRPIRTSMKTIGLAIRSYDLIVTGLIEIQGDKVYLRSTGDNTRFELLNPPIAEGNKYIDYKTKAYYSLYPDVRKALEEFKSNDQEVQIGGYLLLPWRNQNVLIISNYKGIEKEEEENKNNRR